MERCGLGTLEGCWRPKRWLNLLHITGTTDVLNSPHFIPGSNIDLTTGLTLDGMGSTWTLCQAAVGVNDNTVAQH